MGQLTGKEAVIAELARSAELTFSVLFAPDNENRGFVIGVEAIRFVATCGGQLAIEG